MIWSERQKNGIGAYEIVGMAKFSRLLIADGRWLIQYFA